MLVLNNGVPKSGSTWVVAILRELLEPGRLDPKWQRPDWNSVSVHPDRLQDYVDSGEWRGAPVVLKTHIAYEPKFQFLLQPEIRVIVTYRNLPDSVLSMYHHQIRNGRTDMSLEQWLEKRSSRFSEDFMNYRKSWAQHDDVLMIPYETMVADAAQKVAEIAAFLRLEVSAERCAEIAEITQVRLKPGEAPRDGQHARTGGQSRARLELPAEYYERFAEMEAAY